MSFASRAAELIGTALHARLTDWGDESEGSQFAPVESLYYQTAGGWTLDPEWVRDLDGEWRDVAGAVIDASVPKMFNGAEQIAAYGAYLINVERRSFGPPPKGKTNAHGFSRESFNVHRLTCIALVLPMHRLRKEDHAGRGASP